mgnify:CR=1 FL=1|tara:strand:- start:521 stop:874 length:354 start_codon:yes stop_codon:yes gene_type:complete
MIMELENLTVTNFALKVLGNSTPCVIKFYRNTCFQCTTLKPIVLKLAKKYEGQLRFFLVHDKKDNAELGKLFKIDGVPSIFLFSRGGRIEVPYPEYGFNEKYLDEKFANYLQTQKGE